jgi:peptide/nickel transport system permease protein
MSERRLSIQPESEQILLKARTGFFVRVAKYTMVRILTLAVMLIIGMFVAVIVLNKGGFIDQIYHADIEEALGWYGYSLKDATPEEKQEAITKARYAMEEAAGLHTPFLQRCVRWTIDALTLHLGNTTSMTVRGRTISIVEMLVKERLPYTLLLFGVSNFLIFFISIFFALYLFRKYEGLLDRIVVFLSPLSSIPSWLHGVFLVIVFCAVLRVLPYPRSFTRGLEVYFKHDIWLVLKYMILPVTAIFLNLFFQSVYSWRTYFLLQSGEDYLELAKAKGLPDKLIERRYLLRPSLPYILTSLAMTMIGVWQMSLILEKFFFWPGLGSLFFDSLSYFPFTGSIIVLFAYLLAFTVLILDISYALVDPRVRIGSNESVGRVARKPRPLLRQWLKNRSPIFRPRVHLPEPVFKHHVSRQAAAGLDKSQPEPYPKPARAYKLMVTEIRRYPSAMLGVAIIGLLILVSICTVIAIPYKKAVTQWRGDGNIWVNNPKFAQPSWSNWFRKDKLPTTIILDNRKGTASKVVKVA